MLVAGVREADVAGAVLHRRDAGSGVVPQIGPVRTAECLRLRTAYVGHRASYVVEQVMPLGHGTGGEHATRPEDRDGVVREPAVGGTRSCDSRLECGNRLRDGLVDAHAVAALGDKPVRNRADPVADTDNADRQRPRQVEVGKERGSIAVALPHASCRLHTYADNRAFTTSSLTSWTLILSSVKSCRPSCGGWSGCPGRPR